MQTHKMTQMQTNVPEAYLANGLIGLRTPQIPLPHGTALVNGFVGLSPEKRTEEYAEAPYPVGADLQLGDSWLSERPDLVRFIGQEYDFSCGELRSHFVFVVESSTAEIEVVTFCSRTQPGLALQEVRLHVDTPVTVVMQAHIDPRGLDGKFLYRCMPEKCQDGILHWESRGGISTLGAAYISEFQGGDLENRRRNNFGHEEDRMLTQYRIAAKPGRNYVMRQIGALVPSVMHGEPHWQAARLVDAGMWSGFDEIRSDNRDVWKDLWKGRPVLVGADDKWQTLADACFFYLHSSVHQSSPCSVAPFGLSRRKEYSGHVFWDTETFMYPPVLLSNPAAARSMLDYRCRQVPWARMNAKLNGYAGVQFPWQAGNHGWEVTPFYSDGIKEEHINLDVAFAMIQYVYASGDDLFFRQQAWPVIQGVAEWIASRVKETGRGFEIRHLIGIDESLHNINNDTETNALAVLILRQASKFACRLGLTPPKYWCEIADRMFIPIDAETRILLKHDKYDLGENQACTDAMMLTFPFEFPLDDDVREATVRYNIQHAHTYLGMPMNSANFSVWACRAGEREKAIEFLEAGMMSRLEQPYWQLVESTKFPFAGSRTQTLFVTACGAYLTALMQGLTGLFFGDADPKTWARHPITLPAGWEAIEIEQIWVQGNSMRLTARQGDPHARLESLL